MNAPRLAGVLCWHYDAAKTFKHADALAELCAICDAVFVLDDASDPPLSKTEFFDKYPKLQSVLRIDERNHAWNDWTAHNHLLIAAAKAHCDYVFWLDDDESIWPRADRALIDPLLLEMKANPSAVAMNLHWDHVWDEPGRIRTGAPWMHWHKSFLQKNPFYISGCICFANNPLTELHSWPVQTGALLISDKVRVLHYALMTADDRRRWLDKYEKHDPENRFNNPLWKEYKAGADQSNVKTVRLEDL